MNRFSWSAPVLAGAVLLAAGAPAPASAAVSVETLGNGLRVVYAPDSLATAVDVAAWYPGGSRDEKPGKTGLTHLVERMMFRGSAHVADGEHRRRLLAEGGVVNTTTTPDYSAFWQTVPAEVLPTALRFEADRMAGAPADPAAFQAERAACLADAKAREARAAAGSEVVSALLRLRDAVFQGHPYARALEGTPADVQSLTPADLDAWRKDHDGPSGAVLTIVGRFDLETTRAFVQRVFGALPRRGAGTPAPARIAPPTAERRASAPGGTPVRLLLAGWRCPGAADPDAPAIELLAQIMGEGESSRLQSALVGSWAAAYVTQGGVQMHRDASMLWGLAALREDADSTVAEHMLTDEFARLTREPVPGDELDRVRTRMLTRERFQSQTTRARAAALGEALIEAGDVGAAEKRLDTIARLTPADLQRVAQRVLTESARALVWVVPQGGRR